VAQSLVNVRRLSQSGSSAAARGWWSRFVAFLMRALAVSHV